MGVKLNTVTVALFCVIALAVVSVMVNHGTAFAEEKAEASIEIDAESRVCVDCHTSKDIAVNLIDQWKKSKHAQEGVGCVECHTAKKSDFDAFTCSGSSVVVAKHPTPKDCEACHPDPVKQHRDSKHGLGQNFYAIRGADRNLLEPAIATKNGCDECHNIGNYWPDGSIGECDACHPKHTFDVAVARNPYTCGECHIGPDHPHIEQWLESKHGNVVTSKWAEIDFGFNSTEAKRAPVPAPVCTTCHMDAAPGVKATHNVSERLSWEMQAPYSFRTVWNDEKWEPKRERMEGVCNQCHGPSFYETYLLTADLVQLQYNEFRKAMVGWITRMEKAGIVSPLVNEKGERITKPGLNGYDEEPEETAYNAWHHQGRRFRMGAMMMSPDYTQWHGIWELQHDLISVANYAAEHGLPEAKTWAENKTPAKFYPYALFDVPGVAWGISTISYKTPWTSKTDDQYWPKVKANVEAAYTRGLLNDEQWKLWMKMYDNRDHYLGLKYEHPAFHAEYERMLKMDKAAVKEQILDFNPPSGPFYDIDKGKEKE
jgi:hydroxylamine dehydrogenase